MADRSFKRGRWGELIREPDDGEGWELPLSAEGETGPVLMEDGDEKSVSPSRPMRASAWGARNDPEEEAQASASPRRPRGPRSKRQEEETADETFKRALRSASAMLARTEYPADALRRKLSEKGFDGAIIEDVIDRLSGAGLLKENAMAERRAEYLYRVKGYGPMRIPRELRRLGFSSDAIDLLDLSGEEFDFPGKALQILQKSHYEEAAPAIRRLMAYGYPLSMAKNAWRAYLSRNGE